VWRRHCQRPGGLLLQLLLLRRVLLLLLLLLRVGLLWPHRPRQQPSQQQLQQLDNAEPPPA
jgi:hypothetical protein